MKPATPTAGRSTRNRARPRCSGAGSSAMKRTTPTIAIVVQLAPQVGGAALLDRRGEARMIPLPGDSASSARLSSQAGTRRLLSAQISATTTPWSARKSDKGRPLRKRSDKHAKARAGTRAAAEAGAVYRAQRRPEALTDRGSTGARALSGPRSLDPVVARRRLGRLLRGAPARPARAARLRGALGLRLLARRGLRATRPAGRRPAGAARQRRGSGPVRRRGDAPAAASAPARRRSPRAPAPSRVPGPRRGGAARPACARPG